DDQADGAVLGDRARSRWVKPGGRRSARHGGGHAKALGEPAHHALQIMDVPAPLAREPGFAVADRLRVPREEDPRGPALVGKIRAPGKVRRRYLEDRDPSAVADVPLRRVEKTRAERR